MNTSEISSRDTLTSLGVSSTCKEERRRTGRYIAGATVLALTLLTIYHVLLRDSSTIAGVCIPAIIMISYIVWILYSARRDKRKALRLATAMQLTEVISMPTSNNEILHKDETTRDAINPEKRDFD